MFQIEEELKKLPKKPGVYVMRDKADGILYVGKAKNLHNRVRSYFRENIGRGPAIDKMVSLIARFEYIVTDSELEALVLENNLIKEHSPKYNTLLKDDKTYPYVKVTLGEPFPRILFSRSMKKDKSKYFGPYTSAAAVKDTIDLLNKLYQLRTCNKNLPRDIGAERPCLNHHIKQCLAPCQGYVDEKTYRAQVNGALEFLNGNYALILRDLEQKMKKAAEELEFEEAARYRDLYNSVKSVAQKQKITDSGGEDKDVIALHQEGNEAVVQVFFVRDGKLIGREHYYMTHVSELPGEELFDGGEEAEYARFQEARRKIKAETLRQFLQQFYAGTPFIPREIMIQYEVEDLELIEQWLTGRKGARVYLRVPKIGSKEKLVELAAQNAKLILDQDREHLKREEGRTIGAVKEIAGILGLTGIERMEAFDISNTNGFENVASMVVFEKGKPKPSDYRKFRIKTVAGPDDYACMREALTRRFTHGLEEAEELRKKGMDEKLGSFTKFPDLLMMDGGRGQVNVALEVLKELGVNVPVCGMVKDDNHHTRGLYFNNVEMPIDVRSEGFKLITRVQDEAHRFAIEYHRSLRGKTQVKSVLEEIPGVGPSRRKALMRKFGSLEEIKNATLEQMLEIPELNEKVAKEILAYFQRT
ncbi:MAG: excinuclease ABC subunit UvrC [Acetatifactor sp.]|nr:excinuclease ABC subunit UvrC [Acetatifactor sp.]